MGAQELGEENKENNPSETAVLQQTVNRLNMDLHELRVVLSNKDADIQKLNSECSQLQTQLQEVVSTCVYLIVVFFHDNLDLLQHKHLLKYFKHGFLA